jgi:HPt (histidine-containing phosphotransfer) domain-containing protein
MMIASDDWESDPEFKAMRQEFVDSFGPRKQALDAALARLKAATPAQSDPPTQDITAIAHKIAGTAQTYGFPKLTEAAAALEDWITLSPSAPREMTALIGYTELLSEMLDRAHASGRDPSAFDSDARFKALIAASKSG